MTVAEGINHTEQAHQAHILRAIEHAITYDRLTAPSAINLFPEHGWAVLRFADGNEAAVTDWAARTGAELAHDTQSFDGTGGRRWHEFGSRPADKQGTLVGWRVDLWCAVDEPEANRVDVEQPQNWYFTFGAGQTYDGRFVRIHGTEVAARKRMNLAFGYAWCDQYDDKRFTELGLRDRLVELTDSQWPAHGDAWLMEADAAQVGE